MKEHVCVREVVEALPASMAELPLACPDCRARVCGLACTCGSTFRLREGVLELMPRDTPSESFYEEPQAARYGHGVMPERERAAVLRFLAETPSDSLVVEVGAGRCFFQGAHPRLVMTDYSLWALTTFGSGERLRADAQRLPFADASVDAIYSVATLEHVPRPELALEEIDRILAPGGRALLFPAWLVFPWRSANLEGMPYSDLLWRHRWRKAVIPLRRHRAYRFAAVLPRRLVAESALARGKRLEFTYRRLKPNLDVYLTSDSDAYASMDPHACATFFVSRGYELRGYSTRLSRLTMAYVPVEVTKPASDGSPHFLTGEAP